MVVSTLPWKIPSGFHYFNESLQYFHCASMEAVEVSLQVVEASTKITVEDFAGSAHYFHRIFYYFHISSFHQSYHRLPRKVILWKRP